MPGLRKRNSGIRKSKVDAAAKELGLAVGGKLPIDPSLTELSDAGAFANAKKSISGGCSLCASRAGCKARDAGVSKLRAEL